MRGRRGKITAAAITDVKLADASRTAVIACAATSTAPVANTAPAYVNTMAIGSRKAEAAHRLRTYSPKHANKLRSNADEPFDRFREPSEEGLNEDVCGSSSNEKEQGAECYSNAASIH